MHFPHYNLPIAFPGRFVTTIHDLFSFRFPDIHSGVIPRTANHLLIANAVSGARAIITPSQATTDEVGRHVPQGAPGSSRSPRPPTNASARAEPRGRGLVAAVLGITPPYMLYLGQWKTYKNVPLLIEALADPRETARLPAGDRRG